MSAEDGSKVGLDAEHPELWPAWWDMTPEQQAWVKAKQERGLSEARLQALASKLPSELRGASLDNYEITNHEAQLPIYKTVTEYCENIKDNLAKGIGLFLMGSCGTGKDHLVYCAAQAAIKAGAEVYFIHGVTENFHLSNGSREDVESSYGFAIRDQVLWVSDIAASGIQLSNREVSFWTAVINARRSRGLTTFVTMNARTTTQCCEIITAPLYDRLFADSVAALCVGWSSERLRKDKKAW